MKKGKLSIIIPICVLLVVIIAVVSCINFPVKININSNIAEMTITSGKDGVRKDIDTSDTAQLVNMLNGLNAKTYSLISTIKGDALKTGWVYRISYTDTDGNKKTITVSSGDIVYNGKQVHSKDNSLENVLKELNRLYTTND